MVVYSSLSWLPGNWESCDTYYNFTALLMGIFASYFLAYAFVVYFYA